MAGLVVAIGLAVGACSGDFNPVQQMIAQDDAFKGGVAVEEPHAALIARDVLASGGSAADAVVAAYFTLAVTLPSAAGLGGGGQCLLFEAKPNTISLLDFRPAPVKPRSGRAESGGIAIPGNTRGMAALHARGGVIRWEELVFAGERLARFGHNVSRSFARDLAAGAGLLSQDGAAAALFLDGGVAPREGARHERLALATVLAKIRAAGGGALYSGPLAHELVSAANALGSALTVEDLRGFVPKWTAPRTGKAGNHTVYFNAGDAGRNAADLWRDLFEQGAYRRASPAARPGILRAAEASSAPAGRQGVQLHPRAATSIVAADAAGNMAACAVSMGRPFGTGRVLPGLGMLAAPSNMTDDGGSGQTALLLMANTPTKNGVFALAAGGAGAGAAVVGAALRAMIDQRSLEQIVSAPPGVGARVNAILCREGIPNGDGPCEINTDPRGLGLAVGAGGI